MLALGLYEVGDAPVIEAGGVLEPAREVVGAVPPRFPRRWGDSVGGGGCCAAFVERLHARRGLRGGQLLHKAPVPLPHQLLP